MADKNDHGKVPTLNGVDMLPQLCRDNGATIGPEDGVLLITVSPQGIVTPNVLRVGLLSEGRIEAAQMSIYSAIVRARGKAALAARQHQEPARHSLPLNQRIDEDA